MYWLGWEMGAVEAISLSILVGSSVDYCLHLVEGYLLAGETLSSLTEPSLVRLYVAVDNKLAKKVNILVAVVFAMLICLTTVWQQL